MIWFAIALISYLIGSVPSGYIAGRIGGVDIRTAGSGNIGATNVTRTLGKRYGYPVFIADFAKGIVSVFLATQFARRAQMPEALLDVVAAVCCVLGNAFPIWLGFRGGKGVAVSAGLLFALMPLAAVIAVLVWVVLFYATRYVSLASILAAVSLPVVVFVLLHFKQMTEWTFFYVSIALTAFVVFRHRSNITNLLKGTEHRFDRRGD